MSNDVVYIVSIAGRRHKDGLLDALAEANGHLMNVEYARSSIKANALMDAFGLVHEENKVLLTCLLQKARADELLDRLASEFSFDKSNTGIAFTVPVEKISF